MSPKAEQNGSDRGAALAVLQNTARDGEDKTDLSLRRDLWILKRGRDAHEILRNILKQQ